MIEPTASIGIIVVPQKMVQAARVNKDHFGHHLVWWLKIGEQWVSTGVPAGETEEERSKSERALCDALGWETPKAHRIIPPGPWPA